MLQSLYQSETRHATWLELFFDLVFVAVIGVVTHDLSHTHNGHIALDQLLRFPLVFIPVWWIWATHTLYANRFDSDNHLHRVFTLILMGVLVILSTFANDIHTKTFSYFTLLYAAIRVMLAMPYLRIHSKHKNKVDFAQGISYAILIGAAISLSALLFDGILKFVIFYAGIGVDMLFQLRLRHKTREFPVDREHLVERIGLLTIIILGESVISMVGGLSYIKTWDVYTITSTLMGFVMIWAIWWIYFDSFSMLEKAKRITDGNILIYTHLILCIGLILLANLIGHAIKHDLDTETFRLFAITGMCGFYFGKQVIYYRCFPPFRKMILINTFVCIAITVISTFLPRIEYSLTGITFGMLFYVYSTFKWLLPNNIDEYIV